MFLGEILENAPFAARDTAVSYTHLDVYKRQPGDVLHLRVVVEVLVRMCLVHEQAVNTQLLEGDDVVLRCV